MDAVGPPGRQLHARAPGTREANSLRTHDKPFAGKHARSPLQ